MHVRPMYKWQRPPLKAVGVCVCAGVDCIVISSCALSATQWRAICWRRYNCINLTQADTFWHLVHTAQVDPHRL